MDIDWQADRGAAHRSAVVFACDGRYLRFARHAAEQIARLAGPERPFDIALVSTEEMPDCPKELERDGVRNVRVDIDGLFDGLFLDARRTPAVYARLTLPSIFARDYERILYLDADIFVQGGDFAALLGVDLGGRVLGAVRDNTQWRTPGRRVEEFRRLGLPAAPYFNSGMLLIDVARWNEADMLTRAVAFGRENRARMMRHDQNLLNGLLHGDFAELSPMWNWQYTWSSMLFETLVDAHVVHFIGSGKPWNSTGRLPRRFRAALDAFLQRHYGESIEDKAGRRDDDQPYGPAPMEDARRTRRLLLRHLMGERRMRAYLARFPTPLTVIT